MADYFSSEQRAYLAVGFSVEQDFAVNYGQQEELRAEIAAVVRRYIGDMGTNEVAVDLEIRGTVEQIDPRLLMPVRQLLDPERTGLDKGVFNRACHSFERDLVVTARDVAALGEARATVMRDVKEKARDVIRADLATLGVKWEKEPTIDDHAQLYSNLSEIPLIVAGIVKLHGIENVQQLLDLSLDDLELVTGLDQVRLFEIRFLARSYATRFVAIKRSRTK